MADSFALHQHLLTHKPYMVVKLLRIQLALSGRSCCPPYNDIEKILVQIKDATAYEQF